ncbi:hypothetical protein AVEN_104340-1 [Araneus ventricosus]|uniref:Uncharacterized protein n=1 Tax=Araneus ventricosus TaxID=182803 RepID=A0A4Y2BVH3_ARAVE|nr:hypothetical protein AVEN_104340-1 [Araneus ventricosus]
MIHLVPRRERRRISDKERREPLTIRTRLKSVGGWILDFRDSKVDDHRGIRRPILKKIAEERAGNNDFENSLSNQEDVNKKCADKSRLFLDWRVTTPANLDPCVYLNDPHIVNTCLYPVQNGLFASRFMQRARLSPAGVTRYRNETVLTPPSMLSGDRELNYMETCHLCTRDCPPRSIVIIYNLK